MSRKKSTASSYIVVPIIYMIIGGVCIFILGSPLYRLASGYGHMMITKGAPSYPNEYDSKVFDLIGHNMDISEIQIPRLGAQYGYIHSESVDMNAPIYYGDSEELFLEGAGQYVASGLPGEGKPILIGGHDVTYFAPLEFITEGDKITIDTNYGRFEYVVTHTAIADAGDTTAYDLTATCEQLILYTCYPFGEMVGSRRERYFVYCDRVLESSNLQEEEGTR